MPQQETSLPTEMVLSLVDQGMSNDQIIQDLEQKGYSYQQISNALNQVETKRGIEEIPPAPTTAPSSEMQPSVMYEDDAPVESPAPPEETAQQVTPSKQSYDAYDRGVEDQIEEIAEAIIDEKWQKVLEDIGDLSTWKEKVTNDVASIKQEVLRVQHRFESLQQAIIGKIKDYDENIATVGTDVRALEKLLQKIIGPLTTNVKELSRITEKLKK